jgi:hypothetical protein
MRDFGIPKLLTWRWAPCAALVLGSLSFVGFVTLAIPERIGGLVDGAGKASSLRLGNHLARSRTGTPESQTDFSGEGASDSPATASPAPSPVTRVAQHSGDNYPRRGFSPPLDRPAPPPAPPPVAFTAPAPPPAEAAPAPPAPPSLTLVPPPTPEPAAPQADLAQAAAPAPVAAPGPPATE